MATTLIDSIELSADSNIEFFMIHGYSGSPTDFYNLPYLLHEKFNANVKVLLLKGHGTEVKDLDHVSYEDLFSQILSELEKDVQKGRKIILCGVSMGGLFSLLLATKFKVEGIINISTPYLFKFPFNVPGLELLGLFKKYWNKHPKSNLEVELRKNSFSYTQMHKNGLSIVKKIKKAAEKKIHTINCPILTIHSKTDPIGHYKSIKIINNTVSSAVKDEKLFSMKEHNLFFSPENNILISHILNFVEDKIINVKDIIENKRVVAVVPSFNEAERISSVLETLTQTPCINEIVVIDDGSIDNTEEIVKKFNTVTYLKNKKNIGKAGSMEIGVQSTDANIIFFCDADLIGITPEIIEGIVSPVTNGQFSMFIGLRENFMQNSVHLFAINSGERALHRDTWNKLPKYFKHKYRVEAGLNYFVRKYYGGFGYKTFGYSQPIKENKYGFLKGTYLRWSMNIDVAYVYARETLEHIFKF